MLTFWSAMQPSFDIETGVSSSSDIGEEFASFEAGQARDDFFRTGDCRFAIDLDEGSELQR